MSVADRSPWVGFAESDPYYYIDTGVAPAATPAAIEHFYAAGAEVSRQLLAEVDELLPGHAIAVELGCGVGRLLIGTAARFERALGVDVAPRMLDLLTARAAAAGTANIETFAPDGHWDEPETADYVYSCLVFQHIERTEVIADYLRRAGATLRHGGIAQLQFDTRPQGVPYRLRAALPDRLLPRTQRRGIRRIRRDPTWVRRQLQALGLEIVRERGMGSDMHWFVARRP